MPDTAPTPSSPQQMRAVRLHAVGEDPQVMTVPVPEPGQGEVRVAVRACGICGSDLHIIEGSTVPAFMPITLGHEPSGVVDALGPDVQGVAVGTRVAINPMMTCGACAACVQGRVNLCPDIRVAGLRANGAHAEYVVVPAGNVIPLPDRVDFPTAAIVTDAVATPLRAIRQAGLAEGDTAAVFGLGGLGIHAVLLLRQVFGVRVIGVDIDAGARARALQLGAHDVVDPADGRPSHTITELLGGGVDAALEFVGSALVVDQALRSLRPGGRCVVVGVTPDRLQLSVRQETLVARELALMGSLGYLPSDIVDLLELIDEGQLDLSGTITHSFPLSEYQQGLDALRSPTREAIRVVITMDGQDPS